MKKRRLLSPCRRLLRAVCCAAHQSRVRHRLLLAACCAAHQSRLRHPPAVTCCEPSAAPESAKETVESKEEEEIEVPEGFPFEIEDNPGQETVTLIRDYNGEKIVVEVHMPDLGRGEENEKEDDDDDAEQGNQSCIPLVVRISRDNGPSLEFGCTAYADEIAIDSLSIKDPNSS